MNQEIEDIKFRICIRKKIESNGKILSLQYAFYFKNDFEIDTNMIPIMGSTSQMLQEYFPSVVKYLKEIEIRYYTDNNEGKVIARMPVTSSSFKYTLEELWEFKQFDLIVVMDTNQSKDKTFGICKLRVCTHIGKCEFEVKETFFNVPYFDSEQMLSVSDKGKISEKRALEMVLKENKRKIREYSSVCFVMDHDEGMMYLNDHLTSVISGGKPLPPNCWAAYAKDRPTSASILNKLLSECDK